MDRSPSTPAEQQKLGAWLCEFLRADVDATPGDKLSTLSAGDWQRLVPLADRHGLSPLLYRCLEASGLETQVPESAWLAMQDAYRTGASRSAVQYHALAQVLQALHALDIPVIALKGAHLAEIIYESIALRPMGDLDILVQQTDLDQTAQVLVELGYVPSQPIVIEAEIELAKHLPAFHRAGSTIEVHWKLAPDEKPFQIDVGGLWERAEPAQMAGVQALVLAPEDLLLYLCLHIAYIHRFAVGLKAFYDIVEVLRHYEERMDWEQVQRRAGQWGVSKAVYLTFHLTAQWWGLSLPAEVWEALKPADFDPQLAAAAGEKTLSDWSVSVPISRDLMRSWGTQDRGERVRVALAKVFPQPRFLARAYSIPPGSWRVYLYYPTRWRDLLRYYGRAGWRLLRGDKETVAFAARETMLWDWLTSE